MKRFHHKPSVTQGGFTLLEILVVMAIFALLASFILSATLKVRERATRVVCISNLRQLVQAAKMYEGDNDHLPIHYNANAYGRYAHWQEQIYPYVGNRNIFLCPHDASGGTGMSTEGGWPVSYAYALSHFWLNLDDSYRPPSARSPLFLDPHHLTATGKPGKFQDGAVIIIGRYDGSVKATPFSQIDVINYEPEDGKGMLR